MDIIENLKWRYATKKFDENKHLSEEKLNILKEAFNLTATSYGLQTIKLVVIKDKAIRKDLVKFSYGQKQVLQASCLLVLCIQDNVLNKDVIEYYNNIKAIRNTPDIILKPYREQLIKYVEGLSLDEQKKWSTKQAHIALGNLMTVCAIEKIDSCPMEGFISDDYDNYLGLDKMGLKSVLLLPVGYRANDDMFSEFEKVRKPIDQVVVEI